MNDQIKKIFINAFESDKKMLYMKLQEFEKKKMNMCELSMGNIKGN